MRLIEDTRANLISQGRSGKRGKDGRSRYERRQKSRVATSTAEFNKIDMQSLFVHDVLTVSVPVHGETDDYLVRIKFGGFLALLRSRIKQQGNKLDLRAVTRALLDGFNQEDVYISCQCLHPTTKIRLLDGTEPTIQEMYQRFEAGENLYCYSVDSQGDFIPGEVEKVWIAGQATELIEIVLDNGEKIQTTPEHPYMLRNGTYLPACELQEGQSLMPLYFSKANGYETIKYNSHRGYNSTYKMVATHFKAEEIREAELRAQPDDNMPYKVAIHHKDFHKENNNPENLQIMTAREHWMYHASLCGPDRPVTDRRREASRRAAYRRNADPTPAMLEARRKWQEAGRARNLDPDRRQQQSDVMRKSVAKYYAELTEEELAARSVMLGSCVRQRWQEGCFDTPAFKTAAMERGKLLKSPEVRLKAKVGRQRWWKNLSEEERAAYCEISRQNVKRAHDVIRGVPKNESTRQRMSQARLNENPEKRAQRIQRCIYTKIEKILRELLVQGLPLTVESYRQIRGSGDPDVLKYFDSMEDAVRHFRLNHRIISIKRISLETPVEVYDIKMKGVPNFLVSAGVILHNCPDWRYRGSYWGTIKSISSGPPERRPSVITNPKNDLGPGCKHIMLVLSNNSWLTKVARVIYNYILYMNRTQQKLYADVIYPAIYEEKYVGPVQIGMLDKQELDNTLDNADSGEIDQANKEGRKRGIFKQGNPYRFKPNERPGNQISIEQ